MTRKTTSALLPGWPGLLIARAISPWRDGLLPVRFRNLLLTFTLFLLPFSLSPGCGLDWTLPHAHFEGVDEQGYVSYWENIGEADLGDGLVIPVHINFNSHRQSSSPTLGKGWTLPLLESHVEPVDENTMHVLMPDGWTFLFLRNGDTDTWRGNAGWIGQTDGARFTITAPCGWRVKFDTGKIHEIDTPKNRTITIKYNGPDPLEADIDNQPFVQVAQNPATGVAQDIVIGGQKIAITQAPRPRINTILGKTLLTGFDPALNALQWPNGQKETFNFAAPQSLTPTLVIASAKQTPRTLTWDPNTSQIKADGGWTYHLVPAGEVTLARSNTKNQTESYYRDSVTGTTVVQGLDGIKLITTTYVNAGNLNGRIRSVTQVQNGVTTLLRRCNYDEKGKLIRDFVQMTAPHEFTYKYNNQGRMVEAKVDNKLWFTKQYNDQGLLIAQIFSNGAKKTYQYIDGGIKEIIVSKKGKTMVRYLNAKFEQVQILASEIKPTK